MMLAHPSLGKFLLIGGALLALLGLILWWQLPIPNAFPPYLFTALLAAAYGGYEIWRTRARPEKPRDPKA
jgi:4-hydroxybenzoate polyprenyltransferase